MKMMSEKGLGGANTYIGSSSVGDSSGRAWSLIRDGGRVTSVRLLTMMMKS